MDLRSKIFDKTSKNHYRFILTIVLVSVSITALTISLLVTAYYQLNAIHKEFDTSARDTLSYKQNFLYSQTNDLTNYLTAVEKTLEFENFIQDTSHSKKDVESIMMAIASSNSNIMQFRFLDRLGYETIRINKKNIGSSPYKQTSTNLQDKSQRYYFTETKNIGEGNIWFSKVDLNMEHGKVIEPIIPTLRVAKAYYVNHEFKGILIINIFMEKILNEVIKSELFNVAIIDKNSYILTSNLNRNNKKNKKWTRYLDKANENKYTINNKKNFFLELIFKNRHSTLGLSQIIKNNEGLTLVIEEKTEKLIEYSKDILNYMILMGLIVVIISFPIAILLSRHPLKLHADLENSKDDLEHQLNIIDKYVYMSTTDIDGYITDVSTALTKLSGYSKNELIGMNHLALMHPNTPSSLYEDMWENVHSGKDWTHTLKKIAKNGEKYWVKKHVSPIIKEQEISGFTAIREDITHQKKLEKIVMKDELTGAYNRRFFNILFTKELNRAKRKDEMFCIGMIDIDYFKNYNDTYGHVKGDEALQRVVSTISQELQRAGDYLFRVGGEEFIIIYSEMKSFQEAKDFSSKIVKKIASQQIEHKTSKCTDHLTISLGLFTITTKCSMNEKQILQRVDELLYSAKDAGRNQLIAQKC